MPNTLYFLLAFLAQPSGQDGPPRKTGKAAQIETEHLTWEQVYSKFKGFKPSDITEELLQAELRRQAEELLFLQKAKAEGITVTEREIDEAVERVIRTFGGKENFDQYLRSRDLSPSDHREVRRKELLEVKLYRYLIQKGFRDPSKDTILLIEMISPGEIREYYNSHREQFKAIEHCTVFRFGVQWRTPEEKEQKRRWMESIRRKLAEGTDPYLLAVCYPDVIRHTNESGQTDFLIRELGRDNSLFSPETTKYLFETLQKQTFSPVLEDGNTVNILYLVARVVEPEKAFEEAQIRIRAELEHKKRDENRTRLRNELLKKAYVEPPDLFK